MLTQYGDVQNGDAVAALMQRYNGRVCPTVADARIILYDLTRDCVLSYRHDAKPGEGYHNTIATACGMVQILVNKKGDMTFHAYFDPCGMTPERMGI